MFIYIYMYICACYYCYMFPLILLLLFYKYYALEVKGLWRYMYDISMLVMIAKFGVMIETINLEGIRQHMVVAYIKMEVQNFLRGWWQIYGRKAYTTILTCEDTVYQTLDYILTTFGMYIFYYNYEKSLILQNEFQKLEIEKFDLHMSIT